MAGNQLEKHVLDIICSIFDAHTAALFLPGQEGEAHNLAAWFSLGDNINEDAVIRPGEGIAGWILLNREPLVICPFDQHEGALGYYHSGEREGIKAFMGAPIPTGGVVCVDSKRQFSFSDKDSKILQLFAELLAMQQTMSVNNLSTDIARYFANLSLIQNLRFRYLRWPVFLQNFLNTMVAATQLEYAAFASLEGSGNAFLVEVESTPVLLQDANPLRMPVGSGITGWVFHNGQPVFTDGQSGQSAAIFGKLPGFPDFRSAICLPVIVNKSTCGVLSLASSQTIDIDESMRSFVHQAVDHLALFLETLYLKNRLKKNLPRGRLATEGGRAYNPNFAPNPRKRDND